MKGMLVGLNGEQFSIDKYPYQFSKDGLKENTQIIIE